MKKILLLLLFAVPLQAQTDLWGGRTATQGKSFLSLSNVENTALSTWAGTSNITTVGTIGTGTWQGGTIAGGYGGTGNAFFAVSGPASSLRTFTFPNASATVLTDNAAVTVAQGGTGIATTTAYSVICAGTTATGAFQSLAALGASGTVLMSNGAGALPSFQASSGYVTAAITADQTAAVNNAYVNNKATTRMVLTLPATAALGDRVRLMGGSDVGGWKLAQPASTIIRWSGNSSTAGTGGYVQSNSQYDYIEVECISVTNPDWEIIGAQGQLTVQ